MQAGAFFVGGCAAEPLMNENARNSLNGAEAARGEFGAEPVLEPRSDSKIGSCAIRMFWEV